LLLLVLLLVVMAMLLLVVLLHGRWHKLGGVKVGRSGLLRLLLLARLARRLW